MQRPRPLVVVPSRVLVEDGEEISLFRGGPFYRLQMLAHLVAAGRWNLPLRLSCILAVCWLPLVILTAFYYRDQLAGLLKDYRVYSRIVLAIPILLSGQLLMESRFRATVMHVREAELLGADDLRRLNGLLATMRRLRDYAIPELFIVALIYTDLGLIWQAKLSTAPSWAAYHSDGVAHMTPAGFYYGLVSVPIYQFLFGLNLWKWSLWSFFLFRLSRMDLKMVATHPDGHGSLGFLGLSPVAFAPIALALSIAIGGTWRSAILNYGARLVDYWPGAVILLVLMFVVALGPLVFFVPKLAKLRRKGMFEYGVLAQDQAMGFHKKWVVRPHGREGEYLPAPEISVLADLTVAYDHIKRMWPFPADKGASITLALAVLTPLIPVVLAEIPLSTILRGLMQALNAVPM